MKIIFTINTPAQLHFYKNIIGILKNRGIEVKLIIRNYGETKILADEIILDYYFFSGKTNLLNYPKDILYLLKLYKKIKPDVVIGSLIYDAIPANLLNISLITFMDSTILDKISFFLNFRFFINFTDVIITPKTIENTLGIKHLKINSYKELAYLSPNYFSPDGDIRTLLGLDRDEEYVLLRFNAFDAVHDLGIGGFRDHDKIKLVKELEKYAKVFISSEAGVPDSIKDRVLKLPKSRIHDVIYSAKMLVADTGTMVTEAACLGTPAIMFHPKVKIMGNFIELEQKYQLIFGYDSNPEFVIQKALKLIQIPNLKQEWQKRRERLLKDKIDITAFMVWFLENYPESFRMMKERPEIQERFKISTCNF